MRLVRITADGCKADSCLITLGSDSGYMRNGPRNLTDGNLASGSRSSQAESGTVHIDDKRHCRRMQSVVVKVKVVVNAGQKNIHALGQT